MDTPHWQVQECHPDACELLGRLGEESERGYVPALLKLDRVARGCDTLDTMNSLTARGPYPKWVHSLVHGRLKVIVNYLLPSAYMVRFLHPDMLESGIFAAWETYAQSWREYHLKTEGVWVSRFRHCADICFDALCCNIAAQQVKAIISHDAITQEILHLHRLCSRQDGANFNIEVMLLLCDYIVRHRDLPVVTHLISLAIRNTECWLEEKMEDRELSDTFLLSAYRDAAPEVMRPWDERWSDSVAPRAFLFNLKSLRERRSSR